MDLLPDDILEKIYFEKHKLEMTDVYEEIKNKPFKQIELILIELEYELGKYPDVALDIAALNVALRNDGYINDMELKFRLINVNEYLQIYFHNTDEYYQGVDINSAISNHNISIDDIRSDEYFFTTYRFY